MPTDSPGAAYARLIQIRNPGWEVTWDPTHRTFRAAMLDNGRPGPPCLTDDEPTRLEARMRDPVDGMLTDRLCAAVREMARRGLLPDWRPSEVRPELG